MQVFDGINNRKIVFNEIDKGSEQLICR